MGIIAAAMWFFNLAIVLGGYVVLIALIFSSLHRLSKAQLPATGVLSLLLSLPTAWFFLDVLLRSMPEKKLYIFTAFTEITWRPLMLWLALASLALCGIAYALRSNKTACVLFGGASATGAFAGLIQSIVGLFFAGDFYRLYGFELHY